MDMRKIMHRILLANELGGLALAAYRFSDPDGPTGRSGYSFGVCQFDLSHNPRAAAILREIGFSEPEIRQLKAQTCTTDDLAQFSARLLAASAIVDRCNFEECDEIARHVLRVVRCTDLKLAGQEVFFHLCDYHNQFHLDYDGKAVRHFQTLGIPIIPEAVLEYKKSTAWGQKRPDDVARRFNNVRWVCR